MARTALLICNGELPSRRLTRSLASGVDLIVAADGGANGALKYRIRPTVIIGDLDSISDLARKYFASSSILRVSRQDNTDLEKALDYLLTASVRTVTIVGATGRRVDFTLGNLAAVWKYTQRLDISFRGDGWFAVPIRSSRSVKAPRGSTVSLIPFGVCRGITLKGLLYPLTNATMRVGDIAVSNVVVRSSFTVTVRQGKIMAFVLDKA
jgi:thiamine pyrophosphokinase